MPSKKECSEEAVNLVDAYESATLEYSRAYYTSGGVSRLAALSEDVETTKSQLMAYILKLEQNQK